MFSFCWLEHKVHPYICVALRGSCGRVEFSPFAPFTIFELREGGSLICFINVSCSRMPRRFRLLTVSRVRDVCVSRTDYLELLWAYGR